MAAALYRHISRSFSASPPLRWWPPTFARRSFPFMAVPNPPIHRASRFSHGRMVPISSVQEDESGKPYSSSEKDACWTTSGVIDGKHDEWGQNINLTGSKDDQRSATKDHTAEIIVSDDEEEEEYVFDNVLLGSGHRDGSIYRDLDLWWKRDYPVTNRNEKLVKLPVDDGLVELYGYIAARDSLDYLLNYVVNISRDDPITLEEGSLIKMVGPKRGIYLMDYAFLEYDMRIKIGNQEKDDISLIDGASYVCHTEWPSPYKFHISSNRCDVDITLASIHDAVESTIEVFISEVQSRFSLSLGCLTSEINEEISLFDGVIAESCGLKRYVVAAIEDSSIDLKFKVGPMPSCFEEHCCSFMPKTQGHDTQEIKTDFGLIMVKLTWSTLH